MVLIIVHAVSAAAIDIDEYKMSNGDSNISHTERKETVTMTHDEACQDGSDTEVVDPKQSAGLRKMEAITMVWTKKWLLAAYAL
jgi:hypothetical protein